MARLETIQSLSPLQEGMLFHVAAGGGAGEHLVQFILTLEDIDPAHLKQAFADALAANAALRSGFSWETVGKPVAVVMSGVALPWTEEDWTAGAGERLDAFLAADRARGFQLTKPPLMRVLLARESDRRWRLVLSYHHLLMDGWSASLLFDELDARYTALREGRPPALTPRRPYSEFLNWIGTRDLGAAERYWRGQLANAPATGVPLGVAARPGSPPGEVLERRGRVEAATWTEVCALARRLGVTPAAVTAGAWALTLSRAMGEPDVLFGATVAGRPADLAGAEQMIGLFINTAPIRTQPAENRPLGAYLQDLQQTLMAAQEHGHAPLARVLGWAGPERAAFDTLFVYENYPPAAAAAQGGLGVISAESREASSYPLVLILEPGPDGALSISLTHDESRLDRQAAALVLDRYCRMLQAIAGADPGAPVGLIDHRAEADIAAQTGLRGSGADPAPPPLLTDLFLAQVARTPDQPAIIWNGETTSYAALSDRAQAVAAAIGSCTRQPRPLVALAMSREPDMIAAMLGAMLAGGGYLPLDASHPAQRLKGICEAAGADMIICDHSTAGLDIGLPTLVISDALAPAPDFRPAPIDPRGVAYVIATSGSTGTPKPVAISQGSLAALLAWTKRAYPLEAYARAAFASAATFDVSIFEIFAPLSVGGAIALFENIVALDTDLAGRPTMMGGVPSLIGSFEPPASCIFVNVAGEALPATLADRLTRQGRSRIRNLYGPTECTVFSTMAEVRHGEPITIGRPLNHIAAYVLSPSLRPVGVGEIGELYIGGPAVALGYLGMPGYTARVFLPDPFGPPGSRMYRSGDLVRIKPDGLLSYLGRRDGQVKLRGLRIELGEVEAALHAAGLGLEEAAAVIVPGPAGRPRLVACVTRMVDQGLLEAAFTARLPAAFRPQAVIQIEALPLTRSGKLDRKALAAEIARRPGQTAASDAAFRDDTERKIAAAIASALGVGQIGPEDDFFALGGDSIISLQAAAAARKVGVKLGPDQIVRLRTPRAIAAALGDAGLATDSAAPASQKSTLGAIQRRFFEESRRNPNQFNQAILLTTEPGASGSALAEAVGAVQSAHPALRFRFAADEGGWRQFPVERCEPMRQIDLSDLAPAAAEAGITEECARAQAALNIERGPVFAAIHFHLGEGLPGRLLLAAHHLCVDGVSWRIILDDMAEAYAASLGGQTIALAPEPATFQNWVEAARRFARAPDREPDWLRWLALAAARITPLPRDHDGVPRTGAEGLVQRVLDPQATARLLRDTPRQHGTTITAVLLGALGQVLAKWAGGPLTVDLEGHGRSDLQSGLDLSRTVGWFTALYPVHLALTSQSSAAQAVAVASRALGEPDAGVSYGLLRYLSRDGRAERLRAAGGEVLFNYLGQLDSIVASTPISGWASESAGADEASGEARSHLIDINAQTTGGELTIAWRYSPDVHDRATIERLADQHLEALGALAHTEGGAQALGISESARAKVLARLQPKA